MKIKYIKDVTVKRGFFSKELDDYLLKKSSFMYLRNRVIRPSEIGDCPRKIVCSILRFPFEKIITPRQQRIFDMGDFVHKRYLRYYIPRIGCAAKIEIVKKGKVKLEDFIEITLRNPEHWLKGKPDAVIINKKNGLQYIFELKSIKQEAFAVLAKPDWNYIAQVHIYMFMTGIPRAVVFYENKNDQDTKDFIIKQDDRIIKKLLNKIKTIQTYVEEYDTTKQVPECEFTRYNECMKFEIPGNDI